MEGLSSLGGGGAASVAPMASTAANSASPYAFSMLPEDAGIFASFPAASPPIQNKANATPSMPAMQGGGGPFRMVGGLIGSGIGTYFGGPMGGMIGNQAGQQAGGQAEELIMGKPQPLPPVPQDAGKRPQTAYPQDNATQELLMSLPSDLRESFMRTYGLS